MLGALIGDIVGSIYEWDNHRAKDFPLFGPGCDYTDDSVCTVALADALLTGADPARHLQAWCRRHPGRGSHLYRRRSAQFRHGSPTQRV